MTATVESTLPPPPVKDPPPDQSSARTSAIAQEAVRYIVGSTGLVGSSMGIAIPVGIVSALITIHYLRPAQYGELALLMVFASFLSVMYNVGTLHGTFLWVYGSGGDAGDDLEMDGTARASMAVQRRAMGTGLILTLVVVSLGTAFFFIFKRPVASTLLGNPGAANLLGWAAISGGSGSLYRLTCNVFRFERRPAAFALGTVARPVLVLVGSSALLIAGFGIWGAVVGTAIPTLVCAAGCMFFTRRSYAVAFSLADARQIAVRGGSVVIPVVALFVLHNGDIYVLAHWVHGAPLGIYRLASRLGSPPSYLASAFIISWSPLERSALGRAWYLSAGYLTVRTAVLTYYFLAGLTIVLLFVLFSPLLVLVAPASYAEAAGIVPVIALAFVIYGGYIVVLRTVRPERLVLWYTITAVLAMFGFLGASAVLVPRFGIYGPAPALIFGLSLGTGTLLWLNRLKPDPLPIDYRRICGGVAVAAVISGVGLAGASRSWPVAAVVILGCLVAYVPALVLVGAIPRSHLAMVGAILPRWHTAPPIHRDPDELPPAEWDALERLRLGTLGEARSDVEYARLVRALRQVGNLGPASSADASIGRYLASPEPESIRDQLLGTLVEAGADPFELHHLDQLAKAVRRGWPRSRRRPLPRSRALRSRARALGDTERVGLAQALRRVDVERAQGALMHPPSDLELVRAVRAVRTSFGVGGASATDLALASALWGGHSDDLDFHDRLELRRLRRAVALVSRFQPTASAPPSPPK
jgi:O-antigen/teichoic acid export membrane protein